MIPAESPSWLAVIVTAYKLNTGDKEQYQVCVQLSIVSDQIKLCMIYYRCFLRTYYTTTNGISRKQLGEAKPRHYVWTNSTLVVSEDRTKER